MSLTYLQLAEGLLADGKNLSMRVTGGSMFPLIMSRDAIHVESVRADDLSVGDIVLYRRTDCRVVAHRIVGIGGSVFLTKGDAVPFLDEPVKVSDIVGRIYAVEKSGRIFSLKKGVFSVLNSIAFSFSSLTSFVYYAARRLKRRFKRAESIEELFVEAALKRDFDTMKDLADSTDGEKVLLTARKNNISQILYTILRDVDVLRSCPRADRLLQELKKDYISTAAKNVLLFSEFKRVVQGLGRQEIDVLAMKGAALAELVYGDIGMRGMSDIDLLIKEQDMAKTDQALKYLGYSALDLSPYDGAFNKNNYLTTRDYRSGDPLHPSFHIHWHVVNSSVPAPYAKEIKMDGVWRDAVPVEIAGTGVLCMSPHHFLISLCEHAMRVTHSAAKLVYFTDIAALIAKYKHELDWRGVVNTSKDFGLDRFVHGMLFLSRLKTGTDVPQWVLDKLKPSRRTISERFFFNRTAKGKGFPGLGYLVHLGMHKGLAGKLSFIFNTAFPPAWVLAKRQYVGDGKTPGELYFGRLREIWNELQKICIILAICLFLASSINAHAEQAADHKNSTYTEESGYPEYLIAPGDVLDIGIWKGFEEKKYEVTVKPGGDITLALVDVNLADMTVAKAEAAIKEALSKYIREPKVELTVKEYRGRTVTLLGALQSQARIYALKGKTTLTELVMTAGGFTKDADLENIRITRPDGNASTINLNQIMLGGDIAKDVIIDSGWTVFVPYGSPEEKNVFIFGDVNAPGGFKLGPKMTVLQAIAKAGGYKDDARIDEIKVIRGKMDTPQLITANLEAVLKEGDISKDVYLQANDIVYVPKSKIGNWNTFLAKIRPTLEFLILPWAGVWTAESVIKGIPAP